MPLRPLDQGRPEWRPAGPPVDTPCLGWCQCRPAPSAPDAPHSLPPTGGGGGGWDFARILRISFSQFTTNKTAKNEEGKEIRGITLVFYFFPLAAEPGPRAVSAAAPRRAIDSPPHRRCRPGLRGPLRPALVRGIASHGHILRMAAPPR